MQITAHPESYPLYLAAGQQADSGQLKAAFETIEHAESIIQPVEEAAGTLGFKSAFQGTYAEEAAMAAISAGIQIAQIQTRRADILCRQATPEKEFWRLNNAMHAAQAARNIITVVRHYARFAGRHNDEDRVAASAQESESPTADRAVADRAKEARQSLAALRGIAARNTGLILTKACILNGAGPGRTIPEQLRAANRINPDYRRLTWSREDILSTEDYQQSYKYLKESRQHLRFQAATVLSALLHARLFGEEGKPRLLPCLVWGARLLGVIVCAGNLPLQERKDIYRSIGSAMHGILDKEQTGAYLLNQPLAALEGDFLEVTYVQ